MNIDWTAIMVGTGLLINALVIGVAWGTMNQSLKDVCNTVKRNATRLDNVEQGEAACKISLEHRLTSVENKIRGWEHAR